MLRLGRLCVEVVESEKCVAVLPCVLGLWQFHIKMNAVMITHANMLNIEP